MTIINSTENQFVPTEGYSPCKNKKNRSFFKVLSLNNESKANLKDRKITLSDSFKKTLKETLENRSKKKRSRKKNKKSEQATIPVVKETQYPKLDPATFHPHNQGATAGKLIGKSATQLLNARYDKNPFIIDSKSGTELYLTPHGICPLFGVSKHQKNSSHTIDIETYVRSLHALTTQKTLKIVENAPKGCNKAFEVRVRMEGSEDARALFVLAKNSESNSMRVVTAYWLNDYNNPSHKSDFGGRVTIKLENEFSYCNSPLDSEVQRLQN